MRYTTDRLSSSRKRSLMSRRSPGTLRHICTHLLLKYARSSMDYGVGEVYSGVFTVRVFTVYHPIFGTDRLCRRTRTRSGTSCTRQACANTTASGGCRSTKSTVHRSTVTTRTSSTYVSLALLLSLICVLMRWMGCADWRLAGRMLYCRVVPQVVRRGCRTRGRGGRASYSVGTFGHCRVDGGMYAVLIHGRMLIGYARHLGVPRTKRRA